MKLKKLYPFGFLLLLLLNISIADCKLIPNFGLNNEKIQKIGVINDIKLVDHSNRLLVSTSKGLFFLDQNDWSWSQICAQEGIGFFKVFPSSDRIIYFDTIAKNYKIYDYTNIQVIDTIEYSVKWYDLVDIRKTDFPISTKITHSHSMAIHPSEEYIAFLTIENTLCIYDIDHRNVIFEQVFENEMLSIGFDEEGQRLWIGMRDGLLAIYDFTYFMQENELQLIREIQLAYDPIYYFKKKGVILTANFMNSGEYGFGHAYHIHDSISGELIKDLGGGHYLDTISYKPLRFNTIIKTNFVYVILHSEPSLALYTPIRYDLDTQEIKESSLFDPMPFALTIFVDPFYKDGSFFNTLNGNLYLETFDPNFENSNSDQLCSSTDPYKYFYFDKTQPEGINFLTGYRQVLNVIYEKNESSIYFSPSVDYVLEPPLSMSNDGLEYMSGGNARLYSSTHSPKISFSADTGGEVYFTDFSEDDHQIVLCCKNGWYLWDPQTGRELHHQNGHENGVRWGAFSDDGQMLLTAGGEGKIIEWNLLNEEPHEIIQITGPVSYVSYRNTNTQIHAVNETGSVFLIDRSNKNIIQQNQAPYPVQSKDDVDLTQDERYVLIENQILDLQTNTWLPAFGNYEMGNTNIIQVRISPDEKWVGVREAPGIVRVWDWAHVFGGISNINHFKEY